MTALIGYCFNDGAFLVADTRRIMDYPNTTNYWSHFEVNKIHKLTDKIGIATCGAPIDEARLELHSQISSTDSIQSIVTKANNTYSSFLRKDPADTNIILFGHENSIGFIYHLIWNQTSGFTIRLHSSGNIVVDGFLPSNIQSMAHTYLQQAITPAGGYQLDGWAQMVMDDVIKHSQSYSSAFGANPVDFPIDMMIFRQTNSSYKRVHTMHSNINGYILGKFARDSFTV